jgi:hypothetical protein
MRYILVSYFKFIRGNIAGEYRFSYFDMYVPIGERLRTCLEPIADEI